MSTPYFIKGPYDILDYSVDWTTELNRVGETISASVWILASGTVDNTANTSLTLADTVTPNFGVTPSPQYSLGGTSFTDLVATCFISGGTIGTTYTVENAIVTSGLDPRRYSRQFQLVIRNQ